MLKNNPTIKRKLLASQHPDLLDPKRRVRTKKMMPCLNHSLSPKKKKQVARDLEEARLPEPSKRILNLKLKNLM